MQTTMLWTCGVFSTATRWSPTRLSWPMPRTAFDASSSSACLNAGSLQALRDDARPVVRADLGLIGLDDAVERGRIDIALFGQHGLQRADAQLHLRELRTVLVRMIVMRRDAAIALSVNLLCGYAL